MIEPTRIVWEHQIQVPVEAKAEQIRSLALAIEEAIHVDQKRQGNGVAMNRPMAWMVSRSLWDYADVMEREAA